MMGLTVITTRLLKVASLFHRWTIILFGYFIPALSSVKAVVHKDPESFFQWSTYWLILHLYSTILSPILHITLHPIFQLLAILWLSLPRFQGASAVYDRVVVPWVTKYENRVDDAIDEAHRGVQRWVWSRLGYVMATLIGESGNMLEVMLELIFGKPFKKKENNDDGGGGVDETESNTNDNATLDIKKQSLETKDDTTSHSSISSNTTEKKQQLQQQQQQQQPRHSVRDALRQSSTLEDFVVIDDNGNVEHSMEFMAEYVQDFKTMLEQGLYVFFSVKERHTKSKSVTESSFDDDGNCNSNNNGNNFRLGVFSYDTHNHGGVFLITPVGAQETNSNVATLPIYGLTAPLCSGSQSIILEWRGETMASVVTDNAEDNADSVAINVKAEIVLSNEDDRDILYNCLTKCLPWMRA